MSDLRLSFPKKSLEATCHEETVICDVKPTPEVYMVRAKLPDEEHMLSEQSGLSIQWLLISSWSSCWVYEHSFWAFSSVFSTSHINHTIYQKNPNILICLRETLSSRHDY